MRLMPSQLHESHLLLFRNQPALAAQLIRDALGVRLPAFREARIESADLTEVQPAEYRADLAMAAQNASSGLDADRQKIYFDLILNALGEAARQALKKMDARTYEYQSDFARQYIAQGKAEGRAALILRLLALRFGAVGAEIESRIRGASIPELDLIGERLLTARTLEEALE